MLQVTEHCSQLGLWLLQTEQKHRRGAIVRGLSLAVLGEIGLITLAARREKIAAAFETNSRVIHSADNTYTPVGYKTVVLLAGHCGV